MNKPNKKTPNKKPAKVSKLKPNKKVKKGAPGKTITSSVKIDFDYTLKGDVLDISKLNIDTKENMVILNNVLFHAVVENILQAVKESPKSTQPSLILQSTLMLKNHFNQHLNRLFTALSKLL